MSNNKRLLRKWLAAAACVAALILLRGSLAVTGTLDDIMTGADFIQGTKITGAAINLAALLAAPGYSATSSPPYVVWTKPLTDFNPVGGTQDPFPATVNVRFAINAEGNFFMGAVGPDQDSLAALTSMWVKAAVGYDLALPSAAGITGTPAHIILFFMYANLKTDGIITGGPVSSDWRDSTFHSQTAGIKNNYAKPIFWFRSSTSCWDPSILNPIDPHDLEFYSLTDNWCPTASPGNGAQYREFTINYTNSIYSAFSSVAWNDNSESSYVNWDAVTHVSQSNWGIKEEKDYGVTPGVIRMGGNKTWSQITPSFHAAVVADGVTLSSITETPGTGPTVNPSPFSNQFNVGWNGDDVVPPEVIDNQSGDDTWYSSDPGLIFNVDFTDTGGANLNNVQYTIWSGAGMSGSELKAWTDIATGINAASYTNNWGVDFAALQNGTNYVSVRAYDNALNVSSVAMDVFYIKSAVIFFDDFSGVIGTNWSSHGSPAPYISGGVLRTDGDGSYQTAVRSLSAFDTTGGDLILEFDSKCTSSFRAGSGGIIPTYVGTEPNVDVDPRINFTFRPADAAKMYASVALYPPFFVIDHTEVLLESFTCDNTWRAYKIMLKKDGGVYWYINGSQYMVSGFNASPHLPDKLSFRGHDPGYYWDNVKVSQFSPTATPSIPSLMADNGFFSPNASPGVNDTVNFTATITEPGSVNWILTVYDGINTVVRKYTGVGNSVSQAWDGRNESSAFVADGTYVITLGATNADGDTAVPAMTSVVVDNALPTFGGITGIIGTGNSGELQLSWTAATDPSPITYNIYYATTPGGQNFGAAPQATAVSPDTSKVISGLTNDQPYYFVIRAEDAAGNKDSNVVEKIGISTITPSYSKYSGNPVLSPGGAWPTTQTGLGSSIKEGVTYKLWFYGNDNQWDWKIGYAVSPNGLNWTLYPGNPILNVGSPGSWEEKALFVPKVIKDGATYKMWYIGRNNSDIGKIGYATSSDGITWTKSASNPVLNQGGGGEWDAIIGALAVVKVASTYYFYYTGSNGSGTDCIGLATSSDGVAWTKYPSNPLLCEGIASLASDSISVVNVTNNGSLFQMWFQGTSGSYNKTGYAVSQDGINWTISSPNPVLDTGAGWESNTVQLSAMISGGGNSEFLYVGVNGTVAKIGYGNATGAFPSALSSVTVTPSPGYTNLATPLQMTATCHYADSSTADCTTMALWSSSNAAVGTIQSLVGIVQPVSAGSTNITATVAGISSSAAAVTVDNTPPTFGGITGIIGTGNSGELQLSWTAATDPSTPITYNIYYATTPGGQNFALAPQTTATSPAVSKVISGLTNDQPYYFVIRAQDAAGNKESNTVEKIGMSTTTPSYSKYPSNPIITPSETWANLFLEVDTCIKEGSVYKLWYNGSTSNARHRIGYAVSPNGINWTKYPNNPILQYGSGGSWDEKQVRWPSIIYDEGIYKMWYSGINISNVGRIGYATSPDGITWTKSLSNPVLDVGTGGTWDASEVLYSRILKVGSNYNMYYRGSNGVNICIGLATSPDGVNWTKSPANPLFCNGIATFALYEVLPSTVTYDGAIFKMWFGGTTSNNVKIGFAVSKDGVNWTISSPSPVLSTGSGWESYSVGDFARIGNGSNEEFLYYGYQNGGMTRGGYGNATGSWPSALSSVSISPSSAVTNLSTPLQMTATCHYADSSTADCTTVALWTSSSPSVATIQNLVGSLQPVSDGTTNITATVAGISSSASAVTVDNTPPIGGAVTYSDGYTTATTQNITFAQGTDAGSGIASVQLQRDEATLSGGTCGTFPGSWSSIGTQSPGDASEIDTSLVSGKCYKYRYQATDGVGNKANYTSANVLKVDTGAPSGGAVTYPDGYITVTTQNITLNQGADALSGIASVQLQRDETTLSDGTCGTFPGAWSSIGTQSPGDTSEADSSLTSGKCYKYRYLATDGAGNTATYTSANVLNVDTSASSSVAAVNDGIGADIDFTGAVTQLSANWTATSDAESGINRYEYAVGTTAGTTNVVPWTSAGANTWVTKTGLSLLDGQTYYFTVKAINGAGIESVAANSDGITVSTNLPSGGSVTYADGYSTTTSITISFNQGSAPSGIASIQLYRQSAALEQGACGSLGAGIAIGTQNLGSASATDSTLVSGKCYMYFLRVTDNLSQTQDYGAESVVMVDTSAPTNIAGVNDGAGSDTDSTDSLTELSANWTESSDAQSGIARYEYAIGTSPGAVNVVDWTPVGTETSVIKTGLSLTNGQTYYFSVKAVNNAGLASAPISSNGITVVVDGPAGGSISYSNGYVNTTSHAITFYQGSAPAGIASIQLYRMEAALSGGTCASFGSETAVGTQNLGDTSVTDSTLVNGKCYKYLLRVTDNISQTRDYESSNVIKVDTMAPSFGGITGAASNGVSGELELNWSAAIDALGSTPVTYNIYVAALSGAQNFAAPDYLTTSASYTLTGLNDNDAYYVVVRAVDAAGNEDANAVEVSGVPRESGSCVVTSNADSGPGTLRECITFANSNPGGDIITFDISNATITLQSGLPALSDATGGTTINGSGRSITIEGGDPSISISSDDNTVRGLRINTSGTGATISGNHNYLYGNSILGENLGLVIVGESNVIGGSSESERNYIDSSFEAITIYGDSNKIKGNFICTDETGYRSRESSGSLYACIEISSNDNLIGGDGDADRNIIGCSNCVAVIYITFTDNNASTDNIIKGNYIGVAPSGTDLIESPAGIGSGIHLHFTRSTLIERNVIGGTDVAIAESGEGNEIKNNWIGTNPSQTVNLGNRFQGIQAAGYSNTVIEGNIIANTKKSSGGVEPYDGVGISITQSGVICKENRIFNNEGLGIVGYVNGPMSTPPTISSVVSNGDGTFDIQVSAPQTAGSFVELYRVDDTARGIEPDASGAGEGYEFLGRSESPYFFDNIRIEGGYYLTATSTHSGTYQNRTVQLSTSQFGPNFQLSAPEIVITEPVDGTLTESDSITVSGTTNATDSLTVNGQSVTVAGGSFTTTVTLTEGVNAITVQAADSDYTIPSVVQIRVIKDTTDPLVAITAPQSGATLTGAITIIGTVTDPNLASYVLEYGPGANPAAWKQIGSARSGEVFSGALGVWTPSSLLGTYVIRARAVDKLGHESMDQVEVTISNESAFSGVLAPGSWRLMSLPITPDTALSNIFQGTDWRLYVWDEDAASNTYRLKFVRPTALSAGAGFFVISFEVDLNYNYSGSLSDTTQPTVRLLKSGWNLIGTPFDREYPWGEAKIRVNGAEYDLLTAFGYGYISNILFGQGESGYEQVTMYDDIEPERGYWLRAYRNAELVFNPGAGMENGIARVAVNQEPILWKVKLSATSAAGDDTDNYLGVSQQASNGFDMLDLMEPPTINDRLTLGFEHGDWPAQAGIYANDIRPAAEVIEWPVKVEVQGGGSAAVDISWDGIETATGCELELVDGDNVVAMTPGGSYTVTGGKTFKVRARCGAPQIESFHVTLSAEPMSAILPGPMTAGQSAQMEVYKLEAGQFVSVDPTTLTGPTAVIIFPRAGMELQLESAGSRVEIPVATGWNLVGNPFAGGIAFDDSHVAFKTGAQELKLSEAGEYISDFVYVVEAGQYRKVPDDLPQILPGQSFLLYCEAAGTLVLTR